MEMIEVDTRFGRLLCWNDTVGRALQTGVFWDEQICAALNEADPKGWAIDLGANIGWFTLYLAQRHAGVIAVEAHPETFTLLMANTMKSRNPHITLLPWAAYDSEVPLTLAPAAAVGWDWDGGYTLETCPHPGSIVYQPAKDGEPVYAKGTPIDPYVGSYPVSVIKVDVQGCDLRALRGLTETITRCRPIIVFEYEGPASQWNGCSWFDYMDFFGQLNYGVERIREDLWDFVARPR